MVKVHMPNKFDNKIHMLPRWPQGSYLAQTVGVMEIAVCIYHFFVGFAALYKPIVVAQCYFIYACEFIRTVL